MKTGPRLISLSVALAMAIFLMDISIPLGVAAGVPYILVVLVSMWSPRREFTIIMAITGTVLTMAGFILSPAGGEMWKVIFNRFLALFAIWVTAALILYYKRAEDALLESELWMRSIFNSLDEGVLVVTPDRRLVNVNKAAQRIFGYSTGELENLSTDTLHVDHQHYVEFGQRIARAFEKGQTANFEFELKRKGGEVFPTENTISLLKNPDGEPIGIASVVKDITKRKRAEEALNQKQILIQMLQEVALTANEASTVDEAMEVCLEKVCANTGWPVGHAYIYDSKGTLLPTTIWHTSNPEKFREFLEVTAVTTFTAGSGLPGRVLQDGKPHWIIDVTKDKGFVRAPVAERTGIKGGFAFPVLEKKEVVAVLEFFSKEAAEPDPLILEAITSLGTQLGRVTERKRADEALKMAMQKLAKANEEIKEFANIVSHDLRSPLVNLKGFSGELKEAFRDIQKILEQAPPNLTENQQGRINELFHDEIPESFGFIDSSANEMERLVTSIMELARIGVRKMILVEVDSAGLVDEKLKSMQHQIEEKNISVKVSSLPSVVADMMSMEQIFGNILSNAIKYLDPDRRGVIEISGERRHGDTLFKVEDNGIGIPDYGKDKVFALFRRACSKDIPGEGIGMAYVKALIERHEGEIWFESEEGKGTAFFFTIPNKIKPLGDTDG